MQAGVPVDDITARLMEATRRAAGAEGASWDWVKEERVHIRKGAIGSAVKKLCLEFDPATGEIPVWVPPGMRDRWVEIVAGGGAPRVQFNGLVGDFSLRDVSGQTEAQRRTREARTADAGHTPPDAGKPEYVPDASSTPPAPLDLPGSKGGFKLASGFVFNPAPCAARNPATIPRRSWLHGKH